MGLRSRDIGAILRGPARQQAIGGEDRLRDLDHLAVGAAGMFADHVEGLFLVDGMSLHEDAFSSLGDRTTSKGPLEGVVLSEPLERDVYRALQSVQALSAEIGRAHV